MYSSSIWKNILLVLFQSILSSCTELIACYSTSFMLGISINDTLSNNLTLLSCEVLYNFGNLLFALYLYKIFTHKKEPVHATYHWTILILSSFLSLYIFFCISKISRENHDSGYMIMISVFLLLTMFNSFIFYSLDKIDEYRTRTSERYIEILARVSKEMGELTRHESDVARIINAINNDFKERNFVGVIKLIALQSVPSADKMVQLMKRIKDFNDDNSLSLGELNIFSTVNRDDVNRKAVEYLLDFMKSLNDNSSRQELSLSDLFQLQFRIKENDNDTGWADKLSHVGSEGTDTLVKAMINIMLINVFKDRVSRKFGDFRIHCMMDEIGKLHPQNVKGILDFANARNILLINSSPTTYNVSDYRYTYLLQKDGKSKTVIHQLISQR